MAAPVIRRYVLAGDYLEPGGIHILSPQLHSETIFVEIRRTTGIPLPFEHIKDLANNCQNLIVDPFTTSHEEVIDCIMLGARKVCIDAGSLLREIELAYAASKQVITKFSLEMWPPSNQKTITKHYDYIRKISKICGRDAVVNSTQTKHMKEWWNDLPGDCKNLFNWHLAPAEGKILQAEIQPNCWLI